MNRRKGILGKALLALALIAPWVPSPLPIAPPVAASTVPLGATVYQGVGPERLADTRPGGIGYQRLNANTIRVQVTGRFGIPADAKAVVLNIAIVGNTTKGYVTAYPTGTPRPTASNVNADLPGMRIANMATVKLGPTGSVDIYHHVPMSLVVDVSGVYVPVTSPASEGRLQTLPGGAFRVLDTRKVGGPLPAQGTRIVDVSSAGVPPNASAVVVNITAVFSGVGYWTAHPNGADPRRTSTLNIDTFLQTRAAQAIVAFSGPERTFSVFSFGGGQLVVDVVGWFTGPTDVASADGLFLPANPLRTFDSRRTMSMPPWNGSTFEFGVGSPIPSNTSAVALNITGTQSWNRGYITAYAAGQPRPGTSNLNFTRWDQTVANHAISRVSGTRGLALFTFSGAHMIADIAGYYTGAPSAAVVPTPANPFIWPNPATRVVVPKIGVNVAIRTGSNLDLLADRGYAATFPSMINVATPGNMMLFGHRTSGSAPFRRLNELAPGDEFTIIGSDGRTYRYQVTRLDITGPTYNQVYAKAVGQGLITAQLVACHPPGSVAYRIVVTGRLIGAG